jgi:hypothetical protein
MGIAVIFERQTILHFLKHRPMSLRCLQLTEQQRCLTGSDYDGRVARVKCQLVVAGRLRRVVIQTEYNEVN